MARKEADIGHDLDVDLSMLNDQSKQLDLQSTFQKGPTKRRNILHGASSHSAMAGACISVSQYIEASSLFIDAFQSSLWNTGCGAL